MFVAPEHTTPWHAPALVFHADEVHTRASAGGELARSSWAARPRLPAHEWHGKAKRSPRLLPLALALSVSSTPNQTVQPTPPCVTPPALASLDRPGVAPHGSVADLGVRPPEKKVSASSRLRLRPGGALFRSLATFLSKRTTDVLVGNTFPVLSSPPRSDHDENVFSGQTLRPAPRKRRRSWR
jgi:hypothetical protein